LPESEWNLADKSEAKLIKKKMDKNPLIGDRRQEIVFIGIKMNQQKVERVLDRCLLTKKEFGNGKELWDKLENPFNFEMADEEEEGEHEDEEMMEVKRKPFTGKQQQQQQKEGFKVLKKKVGATSRVEKHGSHRGHRHKKAQSVVH